MIHVCFLSFFSLIFILIPFYKSQEHVGTYRRVTLTLPSQHLSPGLGIWLNEIMFCGVLLAAEVAVVVCWPLSWPWLPVILVLLQQWASHSRLRLHGMKLVYIEIKDTNFVAALPVKMSLHIPTSYPVENVTSYSYLIPCGKPLLIWLCDKHLRPPWDLPVSPCQLMAKHSFLCFTGSKGSKSMLQYQMVHTVKWDPKWSKSPGIISNRGTGSNVGFFLWR